MPKVGLIIAVLVIALIALIGYSTFAGKKYRVEVCMRFDGKQSCKTVSARSQNAAMENAITGACAELTSGVTNTMNCEQSDPASVRWLQK